MANPQHHPTVSMRISKQLHAKLKKIADALGYPYTVGNVADDAINFALDASGWKMRKETQS